MGGDFACNTCSEGELRPRETVCAPPIRHHDIACNTLPCSFTWKGLLTHLLAVIEQLEAAGAHFRSLRDPIDTTTPQGMFSLQVLGAVAQLERALIAERTRAGLRAARSRGRVGGNPGLRAGDPDAIRKVRASRDAAHLNGVLAQLDTWLPTVRRMRPAQPWGDVVRVLNRITASTWTVERLRRTVRRLVAEGIVEVRLLDRAPRQPGDDRLIRLVPEPE